MTQNLDVAHAQKEDWDIFRSNSSALAELLLTCFQQEAASLFSSVDEAVCDGFYDLVR